METDTQFAFTTQLSKAQFAASVRLAARKVIWFFRIFGLLAALLGALAVSIAIHVEGTVLVLAGLTLAVGIPALLVRVSVGRARRLLDGPIAYRIDAEGIQSIARHTESLIRWPVLDRLEQRPDVLIVWMVGGGQFIPVPVGELAAQDRADLVAFIQAHLAGRAPETVDKSAVRPPTP
ncbi:YcxB family protein [Actinoplanes sp. NPDC049668]|uniref:YcxB family protein n=1 Tax=unclassified Actinoplanes TaxID=2626549 RepID=UPI0033BD26D3